MRTKTTTCAKIYTTHTIHGKTQPQRIGNARLAEMHPSREMHASGEMHTYGEMHTSGEMHTFWEMHPSGEMQPVAHQNHLDRVNDSLAGSIWSGSGRRSAIP